MLYSERNTMRLYTFINFMLSPIQQGIQSSHLVANLFVKYRYELNDVHTPDHLLYNWAINHKTLICLNGGNNEEMVDLCYNRLYILGKSLGLPVGAFYEDQQSLGGLMTCCGIIVPAKIYEAAQRIREMRFPRDETVEDIVLLPAEAELALLLNQYNLAR